jgi:uncharacterized protein YegL
MNDPDGASGHAFLSYARADAHHADRLQRALEAAGILVWRDTVDLWPGQDWESNIRRAITDNALVFLACFSRQSTSVSKSYQNEELLLAIDQLRQHSPDDSWLIPVRFDECEIPYRELGGGRTLGSIQPADLFGAEAGRATEQLIAAIHRVLDRHRAGVLAAEGLGAAVGPAPRTGILHGDALEMGRSSLRCGAQLGEGARGRVFEVLNKQEYVYKEYISRSVNGDALAELIRYRRMLPKEQRVSLDLRTSWPLARVLDGSRVVGSLMSRIPGDFCIATASGEKPVYLTYLCYSPRRAWQGIDLPPLADRIEIVTQIVNLFCSLHQDALVIGDVSGQNILWACGTVPRIFLLGCDSLRRTGRPSALQEGETPDWQDPLLGGRAPDMASDRYKLALAVGRTLAQHPRVRPGQRLDLLDGIPPQIAGKVSDCFAGAADGPADRPTAEDWADALTVRSSVRVRWPQQNHVNETRTMPVYVACDVSESPDGTAIGPIQELVDAVINLSWFPQLMDTLRISIVTFASDAAVALPLSELDTISGFPISEVRGSARHYGSVFRLLKSRIEADVTQLASEGYAVMQPLVFFISSGPPADDWLPSYRELTEPTWRKCPKILAWSTGDAGEARIREIGTVGAFEFGTISPADAFMAVGISGISSLSEIKIEVEPTDLSFSLDYIEDGDEW